MKLAQSLAKMVLSMVFRSMTADLYTGLKEENLNFLNQTATMKSGLFNAIGSKRSFKRGSHFVCYGLDAHGTQ